MILFYHKIMLISAPDPNGQKGLLCTVLEFGRSWRNSTTCFINIFPLIWIAVNILNVHVKSIQSLESWALHSLPPACISDDHYPGFNGIACICLGSHLTSLTALLLLFFHSSMPTPLQGFLQAFCPPSLKSSIHLGLFSYFQDHPKPHLQCYTSALPLTSL